MQPRESQSFRFDDAPVFFAPGRRDVRRPLRQRERRDLDPRVPDLPDAPANVLERPLLIHLVADRIPQLEITAHRIAPCSPLESATTRAKAAGRPRAAKTKRFCRRASTSLC